MDLLTVKNLCENKPGGIKKLAEDIGMTEANLHRCIRLNKIQASDLEKIAQVLNVDVSVFFGSEEQMRCMKRSKLSRRLGELIASCEFTKAQIAEKCQISRTTLDNVLAGADAKVSTIEALADVLGVSVSSLFSDKEPVNDINSYELEIARLKSLLDKKHTTKVVVELEVDGDEFVRMGLKDKVVQVLGR
jgi:transcriptional regulator with XRE-family HTH domain/DNA-binding Xre family transcriptional regulator